MEKKYFPIKTDTACQLKWAWSTLHFFQGTTSSCHRSSHSLLSVENFNDFHNTQTKITDRNLMINGKWPAGGCNYCKSVEAVANNNSLSDRQVHSLAPNLAPDEIVNGTEVVVNPTIVEVYFDNKCNMSCIYCSHEYSSKIFNENVKFGDFDVNGVIIKNTHITDDNTLIKLKEQFWHWFSKNSTTLKQFHILGGEPFYQPAINDCLDYFSNNPLPNLEFTVITNLKVSYTVLSAYLKKFKDLLKRRCLKSLHITCSIDGLGPGQEYQRYGINLEQWKKNFLLLCNEKWIKLKINQTISALGIFEIRPLIVFLNECRQHFKREITQHFSKLTNISYLNPDILGIDVVNDEISKILEVMSTDSVANRLAKQHMEGVFRSISQVKNTNELIKLKIYLTEIDRRRNTNWKKTFNWLEQL